VFPVHIFQVIFIKCRHQSQLLILLQLSLSEIIWLASGTWLLQEREQNSREAFEHPIPREETEDGGRVEGHQGTNIVQMYVLGLPRRQGEKEKVSMWSTWWKHGLWWEPGCRLQLYPFTSYVA
jgi:hypothetical protein